MIHFRTLYSKLEDKQCLTIIGTEGNRSPSNTCGCPLPSPLINPPPDRINLGLAGLVMADQIADIFAVIGEVTAIDLRLDPFVPVAQSQ